MLIENTKTESKQAFSELKSLQAGRDREYIHFDVEYTVRHISNYLVRDVTTDYQASILNDGATSIVMSQGRTLPPNYTIRPVRNLTDRWAVFRLLILERAREPDRLNSTPEGQYFYILPLVLLLFFTILFLGFVVPINNWFYVIFMFGLIFLGLVGGLLLLLFRDLFIENGRSLMIALDRGQVVGSALMAVRGNYSVLLGLYVAPRHRRRGIGSQLVQHLLIRNALPVYLNAPADLRPFYTRFGFVETNVKRGYNMVIHVVPLSA